MLLEDRFKAVVAPMSAKTPVDKAVIESDVRYKLPVSEAHWPSRCSQPLASVKNLHPPHEHGRLPLDEHADVTATHDDAPFMG